MNAKIRELENNRLGGHVVGTTTDHVQAIIAGFRSKKCKTVSENRADDGFRSAIFQRVVYSICTPFRVTPEPDVGIGVDSNDWK